MPVIKFYAFHTDLMLLVFQSTTFGLDGLHDCSRFFFYILYLFFTLFFLQLLCKCGAAVSDFYSADYFLSSSRVAFENMQVPPSHL